MEFLSEESSIVHFRLVRISTKGNEWKKPVCEDLVPKITSEDHPSFILQPAMLPGDAFIDSTFYRTPCQCWTVVSCSSIFITCEPSLSIRTNEKKSKLQLVLAQIVNHWQLALLLVYSSSASFDIAIKRTSASHALHAVEHVGEWRNGK